MPPPSTLHGPQGSTTMLIIPGLKPFPQFIGVGLPATGLATETRPTADGTHSHLQLGLNEGCYLTSSVSRLQTLLNPLPQPRPLSGRQCLPLIRVGRKDADWAGPTGL